MTQLLGIGLGHTGSTSKRGATAPPWASARCSSHAALSPSASANATSAPLILTLRDRITPLMVPPTGPRRVRDTKTRRVYTDRNGRCDRLRYGRPAGPGRRLVRIWLMGGLRRAHRPAGRRRRTAREALARVPRQSVRSGPCGGFLQRRWWRPWRSASSCGAHEIPNEVTVQTFLKPDGRTLTFLVRAPLKAMRDVDVPVRENGFLDLARVQPTLEDAARLWIGDFVELFENGQPLARPRITAARVSLPSDKSFASFEEAQASLAGPRLPEDTTLYWQDGLLDVAFAYDIQSDRSPLRHPPGADPARPAGQRRDAAHHPRQRRARLRRPRRSRASSSSTRAGTRRRCASPRTASSTSSTASTTCCSCSAWSSRSAGCGRWSPW